MRKYKRSMIRANAKAEKTKPSKWVKAVWEQLQQKKYGLKIRMANKIKSTHKKCSWPFRISMLASKS